MNKSRKWINEAVSAYAELVRKGHCRFVHIKRHTLCALRYGDAVVVGISARSYSDNYDKKLGNAIAYRRALKTMYDLNEPSKENLYHYNQGAHINPSHAALWCDIVRNEKYRDYVSQLLSFKDNESCSN